MDKLFEIFSRLPIHPRVVIAVVLVSIVVGSFFFLALLSDDRRKRVLGFVFCNPIFYIFIAVVIGTSIFIPLNSDKSESGNPSAPVSVNASPPQKQMDPQGKNKLEPVNKLDTNPRFNGDTAQKHKTESLVISKLGGKIGSGNNRVQSTNPNQKKNLPAEDLSPLFPDPKTKNHKTENEIRIVADSYHVKREEAFIFQVKRFAKSNWITLHPDEVQIASAGQSYSIDGGPVPRFGLKGKGPIVLQVTDIIKGGVTKCTVLFED